MTPKDVAQAMNDETVPMAAHTAAAKAFVDRARSHHGHAIAELYVFGSTVRGEASGLESDVDVLIVIDREMASDALRDIAYDVMLEYGPVVELHLLSESTFRRYREEGHPFIRNVVDEGRSYA